VERHSSGCGVARRSGFFTRRWRSTNPFDWIRLGGVFSRGVAENAENCTRRVECVVIRILLEGIWFTHFNVPRVGRSAKIPSRAPRERSPARPALNRASGARDDSSASSATPREKIGALRPHGIVRMSRWTRDYPSNRACHDFAAGFSKLPRQSATLATVKSKTGVSAVIPPAATASANPARSTHATAPSPSR